MTKPKTTFANGVNPFAQLNSLVAPLKAAPASKPVKENTRTQIIDVCIIDEVPPPKLGPVNKYDGFFTKLKPGQAIKCDPKDVHRIADGLRRRAKVAGVDWKLATIKKHPSDGMGRVYRVA
jgi:hypothetical protein